MKVITLTYTPDPITTIYKACRVCYSKYAPSVMEDVPLTKMLDLISKTLSSGHHSVLEHVSFTFSLEGVSRALTHQLVRHRIASYSQQSQRYVTYGKESVSFVTPETISKDQLALERFNKLIADIFEGYEELVREGIPAEDARYLLPNATVSNIVVTMNYRELINFCKIRLCYKAQWEIFRLTELIKEEICKIDEFLAEHLLPKCQHLGYCDEMKPCGNYSFSKESNKIRKERGI